MASFFLAKGLSRMTTTPPLLLPRRGMSSAYKAPAHWHDVHYSELPVPEGAWSHAYARRQAKNIKHLVLGGGFFLFTVSFMFGSGIVRLNATIPKIEEEGGGGGPAGAGGKKC